MKKLYLLLLISNFAFAQSYYGIEIGLADSNIGYPDYENTFGGDPYQSNNAELNSILQNYGTYAYFIKPIDTSQDLVSIQINFTSPDVSGFITDLLVAFPGLVTYAYEEDTFIAARMLTVKISNVNLGIPIDEDPDIYTATNDEGLNAIFQNFNVNYYELAFPSLAEGEFLKYYVVICDCNSHLLKTTLDNYNPLIDYTEYVSVHYLSNTQFTKSKPIVYPNPFTTKITINTKDFISNYAIYDITGKQIINVNSEALLNQELTNLSSGIYILKLKSESGNLYNQKLIKQ